MLSRLSIFFGLSLPAIGILSVSLVSSSQIKYDFETFTAKKLSESKLESLTVLLPYTERILPDNPLWIAKASMERVPILLSGISPRRVENLLQLADKRLFVSIQLFKKSNFNLGVSTLTKAEKYLEQASLEEKILRVEGVNTQELLKRISDTSLKHLEVIDEMAQECVEEAAPIVVQVKNIPQRIYQDANLHLGVLQENRL